MSLYFLDNISQKWPLCYGINYLGPFQLIFQNSLEYLGDVGLEQEYNVGTGRFLNPFLIIEALCCSPICL